MHSENILSAYKYARSYPDLVGKLITLGVQSYTVEVASGTTLYRLADGQTILHAGSEAVRPITEAFHKELVRKAIIDNQQKKTDYPTFMNDIAKAGVRIYEATLHGGHKRVNYIGSTDHYEEKILV